MTRIVVKKVIFDEYNLAHITRHKVTKEDILAVRGYIIFHKQSYQKRYLAVGRSGTRIISIVLKRKAPGEYYLITARDAGKKERRRVYEIEKDKK
ncbi:hypothetical protein A3D84_01715 [Candidatus Woesebacteria bacterium RIFCSPHIGHO2_02_FULL_42_20]|uniref:BrnT family toxin n=1 Tax=Candidatus Woesebacteria bacterium RIFCSPHIGHO2_12_FULL_41_24 TaxID=1802510 RepID=A0A1F8ASB5_9BACT|nr:MAG: hypothetical protein A2W15_05925 [Candidatus Woesebacteria bacterium RBG_16_41_13]OGM30492.1 MAG: hypothetical protein A2873_02600 [Candidatus Woesebacteria bacterium RIFCSPHIGHO2_01_FULL_42_80]OGM35950.1 MAG: hypothetical protein A3D84_01715 [Candidatus Woesebacteria bacterium RIFCSPHIGHO2_02_FULL_42_20]OGM54158.1 MAG: hypothetical protein A3E44_00545 [Candidatus Woesebacteria bacterium RIFCSPHIGHO2_12_FULL_41_24]OGM66494.1 MAG: hypothetical protein A2969_02580 [Candidatus Woesebacteri